MVNSERWRKISGFGGIYKVSSLGRVRVAACTRYRADGQGRKFGAKFLRSEPKRGYPWVILCDPNTRERRLVSIHVLVAEAFLGPQPTPEHEVNHIDGNKRNPVLSNLEWATHPDNCLHAYKIGLRDQNCRFVTFRGESKKVMDWIRELNLKNPQTIYGRLNRGLSPDVAFDKNGDRAKQIANKNKSLGKLASAPKYKDGLPSREWALKLGITRLAFLRRVNHYTDPDLIYKVGFHPRRGARK